MVETVDLKCNSCGFIGNKLSKDWIEFKILQKICSDEDENYEIQKAYACSKCGTVRIELP